MLQQLTLTLRPARPCCPQPSWGHRMYALMLENLPEHYCDTLHQNAKTPVSQYLLPQPDGTVLWRITLLGQECRRIAGPVLNETDHFYLKHEKLPLTVIRREMQTVESVEQLFTMVQTPCRHRLEFLTAACFRRQGHYLPLPDPRLILQSQIQKWNDCFPECPIEDQGDGLDAMAAGLLIHSFQIRDQKFWLKGYPVPGFVGEMALENQLEGFHRLLADVLLEFSGFAGVGMKTALGMGGTVHHRQ